MNELKWRTQIELETARTYLRLLTVDHALDLYNLNLDPEVIRYTGDKPYESLQEVKTFLLNYNQYTDYGVGRLAIIEKNTNTFIGWCGLKYSPDTNEFDIGFRLNRVHWNKGFATECASKCLEAGFENLGLNKIIGRVMVENKASIKVLEKIGMTINRTCDFAGHEGRIYQIAKSDYEKIKIQNKF